MQWQISILVFKSIFNYQHKSLHVNREIVNNKISVKFTYKNKTDDPINHSKLYALCIQQQTKDPKIFPATEVAIP